MKELSPAMRPRYLLSTLSICLAALWLTSSQAWALAFEPVTGTIEGDYESMTLDIEVTALENHHIADDETLRAKHIGLIVGNDTGEILGAKSATLVSGYNNSYYWEYKGSRKEQVGTQYKFVATITVYRNSDFIDAKTLAEAKTTVNGKEVIMVKPIFRYYENGAFSKAEKPDNSSPIERNFAVPMDAPAGFAITSGHKSLYVNWEGGTAVNYNVSSIHRTPPAVIVMVFKADAGSVTLPASELKDATTGETEDTTCTFDAANDGEECIHCDESTNPIYINEAKPDHEGVVGFYRTSNASKTASMTLSDLEINHEYTVVMQYLQGGKRTVCKKGSPIRTLTLTEINGGDEASLGDPSCFIVTAAYGSPLPQVVHLFRWFRETYLLPTAWGKAFVEYYYAHSPPVADAIKRSPTLKLAAQAVLLPAAAGLYAMQAAGNAPALALLILAAVAGFGLWIAHRRRRLLGL